jgi:hypothetical protein
MTNMFNSGDVYGRAGDWLIGTAKRHPEALLVLARVVLSWCAMEEGPLRPLPPK